MQFVPNYSGINETYWCVTTSRSPALDVLSIFVIQPSLSQVWGCQMTPQGHLGIVMDMSWWCPWPDIVAHQIWPTKDIFSTGRRPHGHITRKHKCRNTSSEVKIHREAPKWPDVPRWGRLTPPWTLGPVVNVHSILTYSLTGLSRLLPLFWCISFTFVFKIKIKNKTNKQKNAYFSPSRFLSLFEWILSMPSCFLFYTSILWFGCSDISNSHRLSKFSMVLRLNSLP